MKWNSEHEELAKVFLTNASRRPVPQIDGLADSECQQLERTLYEFGEAARNAAERPDEFWQRQRAAIWARGPAEGRRAVNRTIAALAGVAALTLLGAALLASGSPPAATPTLVQTDADHELLLAVEHDVQSEVPDALQPAALLAQEMNDGMQSHSVNSRSSKEKTNED